MNEKNLIPTLTRNSTLQETVLDDICQKISDTVNDFEKVSKEKYEIKLKLIESATDMSTQEKLDAIDKNCERWKQEHWKNIFIFAVVSFGLLEFAVSPVVAKTMKN